jgi:hypothetical protein
VKGLEFLPEDPHGEGALETLVNHGGPLLIYGEAGCGVTTMAMWLAARRASPLLDDADQLEPAALEAWLRGNPKGILAAHQGPMHPALAGPGSRCLAFHLPSLEDDPPAMERLLAALAHEEGLTGPLPAALGTLPCPGNLRGLRNRLVRFKLLGQLPVATPVGEGLPLATEDMAANLHVLERLLLHRALRRSYGNRVEAARRLGVSRRQLYLLIQRHGDPVRGQAPTSEGPKRLRRTAVQNSRIPPLDR